MAGKLSVKEMDQLESWMDDGLKSFTLLYSITRDGCDAKQFHAKCDVKGPTVTVLYNTDDSVFGGYNPRNWHSRDDGKWESANGAFLFQLRYNGRARDKKFSHHRNSIYNSSDYGPSFDADRVLNTFHGTVNPSGPVFRLNGYISGNTKDINNGNMIVTELEVYKVEACEDKRMKVWRGAGDWNTELLESLKDEIIAFKPPDNLDISEARIALVGPVGAGKSSLYNTIQSVFRGRITKRACSGSAEQSVTTGFIPYTTRTGSDSTLKLLLCDTPGLAATAGLKKEDCARILDGKIPNFHIFSKKLNKKSLQTAPTVDKRIHCVVFVIDATTLEVLESEVMEKIKEFKCLMNDREIPQLVLLTKIDKLCKDVENDVSFTYKSWVIEEYVEKASQLLGLPMSNIHPVKNYEKELELDTNVNILALLALRQILLLTEDHMLNLLDRNRPEKNLNTRKN